MTTGQFAKKVKVYRRQLMRDFDAVVYNKVNGGGIDLSEYEADSFRPIRIVFAAALREMGENWTPKEKADRKAMENLAAF